MWLDRYEPEPRSLLVLGLGWGAFVATSGALVLQLFDSVIFENTDTFAATVVAPVTEEAAKGLFILLLLIYRRHELDGVLDGLVYAGMVGIGFAFTENILYLTSAYMGDDGQAGGLGGAVGLFVVRCIFGPFAHPFFTAFTGIGIGIAVDARSRRRCGCSRRSSATSSPSCAHAAVERLADARRRPQRDHHLRLPDGPGVPAAQRLRDLVATPRGWRAHRGARRLRPARLPRPGRDPVARPGSPPAASPGRYAEKVGGPAARRTMVAYQNEAVELGFLHSRYLRGVRAARLRGARPGARRPDARAATGSGLAAAARRPDGRAADAGRARSVPGSGATR